MPTTFFNTYRTIVVEHHLTCEEDEPQVQSEGGPLHSNQHLDTPLATCPAAWAKNRGKGSIPES